MIFLISISVSSSAQAAILFEDNFDGLADWRPHPANDDMSPAGSVAACDFATQSCSWGLPGLWDYFRSTGWWWEPSYKDTLRIASQTSHGMGEADGAGKSFIVYNESNVGSSGDGWGADGILAKALEQDEAELYVRFWLKTQPAWRWMDGRIGVKLFRVMHFDRSGSVFQFYENGDSGPIYLYGLQNSTVYGVEQAHSFRCDPQESDYYCPNSPSAESDSTTHFTIGGIVKGEPTVPTDPGMWADGVWHRHDFRLKMNTYAGNGNWNADGVLEFWYDGELQKSRSDIKWINSGTDSSIGWNTVAIGGNAYNLWAEEVAHGEQWYAVDDVVVSTTALPADYVPGVSGQGYSLADFWEIVVGWLKGGDFDHNSDGIVNTRDLGIVMSGWE